MKRVYENKCVSRTDTNPPFAFDIAFFGQGFTGFLQGVQGRLKRYVRCLYGYFQRLLRYVKSANGQKFEFFRIFGPTLQKPLGQRGWLYARMCVGLFPTYATALDDAQENRNGRLQNTKLVLRHSLFGPPCRTPCAMGPYTCDRWIKHFSVCCLYASIYNGCRDTGT